MKLLLIILFAFSTVSAYSFPSLTKSQKEERLAKKKRLRKLAERKKLAARRKTARAKKRRANEAKRSVAKKTNSKRRLKVVNKKKSYNLVVKKPTKPKFRKFTENLNFNYFMQLLGPSLDPNYQSGATYNRFKTGQDFKGDELDATGSHQAFHAITLGYNITSDYRLSFGYTFQEDINKDIKYTDSFGQTAFRAKGMSDNNKRINLFIRNIYENKYFTVSSNYFYELSSTINSVFQDMEYGLGLEPTIAAKLGTSRFSTGMMFSVQRNYFKQNQILFEGNQFPTRYQTMFVQVNPYLNYSINDYVLVRSNLLFDWDKRGDQINELSEFNANMNDVGRIGIDFNIDYGVTAGTFFEFGLEEASLSKTAIGATLNVMLF